MINEYNPCIWTVEHEFQVMGVPVSTRMTLARVNDHQWAAISPVPLTDDDLRQINAHAKVCYIIAPNNFHHLFINEAQAYWPEAELFVPRALLKKRPDLAGATVINPTQRYPWSDDLVPHRINGSSSVEEFAFFHRESSTLVITDICFNMVDPKPIRLKLFATLMGTKGDLKTSRLMKLLYRDKQAMKQSIQELVQLPFERLIVAHGDIIEQDAAARFKTAFAWLLNK